MLLFRKTPFLFEVMFSNFQKCLCNKDRMTHAKASFLFFFIHIFTIENCFTLIDAKKWSKKNRSILRQFVRV